MWSMKSKDWARPTLKIHLQKCLRRDAFGKGKTNVSASEFCDCILGLLEKWDQDPGILKLLIAAIERTLLANKELEGIGTALLAKQQNGNSSFMPWIHSLFMHHTDVDLKYAIFSLLCKLVKHYRNVDGAWRSKLIRVILSFLPNFQKIEDVAELSFAGLSCLLLEAKDDDKMLILSNENQQLLINAYEYQRGKHLIYSRFA